MRPAFAALALFLYHASAFATESVPPPDEIRYIEKDSATSDCLGDPKTPLCAVETELARFLRDAGHFCAWYDAPNIKREPLGEGRPFAFMDRGCVVVPNRLEYAVTEYEEVTEETRERLEREALEAMPGLSEELRQNFFSVFPPAGSVTFKLGLRFYGLHGMVWPPEGWQMQSYTLGRQGNYWDIKGISSNNPVRRVSHSWAASECIGNPVTPLCAVETYFACRTRDDLKLCMIADETYERTYAPWDGTVAFQVFSMRPVEALGLHKGEHPTVFVWLREWFDFPDYSQWPPCRDGVVSPCPSARMTGYAVERIHGRWQVIDRVVLPDEEPARPEDHGFERESVK